MFTYMFRGMTYIHKCMHVNIYVYIYIYTYENCRDCDCLYLAFQMC